MIFDVTTPFPNGLLYLVLEDRPEVPDIDGVANLWQSPSMVAQSVIHDAEGEVHLTVSGSEPAAPNMMLLFQGVLYSSRRELEIWNVYVESLARFRVNAGDFSVRMWGDDPRESSMIHIQFLSGNPEKI